MQRFSAVPLLQCNMFNATSDLNLIDGGHLPRHASCFSLINLRQLHQEEGKMPSRDQTGPNGQGPLSGRGFGDCNEVLRSIGRGLSRGFGPGAGAGRGFGQGAGMGRGGGPGGRGQRNVYRQTGLTGWQRGVRRGPTDA